MKKNTSSLWDNFWDSTNDMSEDLYLLKKEEKSIRWQRIEKLVLDHFVSFEGIEVLEIGSGIGTISALMKLRGANVTLMDYSQLALERAGEFYKNIKRKGKN